jgi:ribosome-associated heat shock protein Hsp15
VSAAPEPIRADKWLWHARFFKTRALAAAVVSKGRMRLNGQHFSKPGQRLRPGDVLTFTIGHQVRVIRVLAPGQRRGPADEARGLYLDLDPPAGCAQGTQPPGVD